MVKEEAISAPGWIRPPALSSCSRDGLPNNPLPSANTRSELNFRDIPALHQLNSHRVVKWLGWCQSRERLCRQRSILLHCPLLQTLKQNNVES